MADAWRRPQGLIVSSGQAGAQRLPNIRYCEYTDTTMEQLRQFKAEIFQALAHPARIAMVEALREGELSAGQLIERLGLEQANGSQHLAVLRAKRVVVNRREGNQVFYSLRDPVLNEVLDILKSYFLRQLKGTTAMIEEMEAEGERRLARRARG